MGKVQGVWFRKGTQNTAIDLGLFGDVQNLKDGSVLVRVSGKREEVLKLLEWCKKGTPHSVVESISFEETDSEFHKTFDIIR